MLKQKSVLKPVLLELELELELELPELAEQLARHDQAAMARA